MMFMRADHTSCKLQAVSCVGSENSAHLFQWMIIIFPIEIAIFMAIYIYMIRICPLFSDKPKLITFPLKLWAAFFVSDFQEDVELCGVEAWGCYHASDLSRHCPHPDAKERTPSGQR